MAKTPEDDIDAELISMLDEEEDKEEDKPKSAVMEKPALGIKISEDEEIDEEVKDEEIIQKITEVEPPVLIPAQELMKPSSNLFKVEKEQELDLGIKQLLAKFGQSVETIINNQKSDREQVEQAIILVEKKVKDAVDSGSKLSPAFLDAYARLLQTKADINTNASKVLDSVAKLLAAGKGNDLIVNINNGKTGELDLEEFLQQPAYEDEIDGNRAI